MDNITHSLIGYALGRATTRGRSHEEQRAAIWSSIAASNAPDLDFVAGLFSENTKLAYLAHHRGHTHTLLWAVPIGFVCAEIFMRAFKVTDQAAKLRLYGIAALAGLLHIGFDFLNNYGVHPFFPLDNRWYYGDAIFIIEPLLFAVLLPLLTLDGLTRIGRGIGVALSAGVLALVWAVSLVPRSTAIIATVALAALMLTNVLAARRSRASLAWIALAGSAAVVMLFAGALRTARTAFTQELEASVPSEELAQLVLTPMPANPVCWSALAITTDPDDTYRGRFGFTSLAPELMAPASCRMMPRGPTTAPLSEDPLPSAAPESSSVVFDLAYEGKLEELRTLARERCEARVLLQFARAPFWIVGERTVAGDMRYDHEPELAFAELEPGDSCEGRPVPWVPPLRALLE